MLLSRQPSHPIQWSITFPIYVFLPNSKADNMDVILCFLATASIILMKWNPINYSGSDLFPKNGFLWSIEGSGESNYPEKGQNLRSIFNICMKKNNQLNFPVPVLSQFPVWYHPATLPIVVFFSSCLHILRTFQIFNIISSVPKNILFFSTYIRPLQDVKH